MCQLIIIVQLLLCAPVLLKQIPYDPDIDNILYGDLSNFDIWPDNYNISFIPKNVEKNVTRRKVNNLIFEEIHDLISDTSDKVFEDLNGFDKVTKQIEARRILQNTEMMADVKGTITDLLLCFLVHMRYKVYAALAQREPIRHDKRFRLGYLFFRLRKLQFQQLAFASIARSQSRHAKIQGKDFYSLLRLYTQILRTQVDIRDTVALVKVVYKMPDPFEIAAKRKQDMKDAEAAGKVKKN